MTKKRSIESSICVVIPAYKVSNTIIDVVKSIGPEVKKIIVVDDGCPEKSGQLILDKCKDKRLSVIFHRSNFGVGCAVKSGYKAAIKLGVDIVVKVDGDGQMDTGQIPRLILPIQRGTADYTKGNRFFNLESIYAMPKIRILGNMFLSFLSKLSSGYWKVFDPNNGFTAISIDKLRLLPLSKLDDGYFFESDMLFRLKLLDTRITDISMVAIYRDEVSNLKIGRVMFEFPFKHFRNFHKRLIYTYYLRDFNLASLELPIGFILFWFGIFYGFFHWLKGQLLNIATPQGTLILVTMCILVGLQLLLSFFSYDTTSKD